MIVYLITNKLNGKRYVGITTQKLQNRINQHIVQKETKRQKKSAISEAIAKHGFENFLVEQIDAAETIQELYEKEKQWIEKLGTFGVEYNLTKGGDGSHGRILSEESKEKKRQSLIKAFKNPELRKKQSEIGKKYFEDHPEAKEHLRKLNTGKKLSPETVEKMRKTLTGKPHKMTEAGRKGISETQKNRVRDPVSEETKEKHREHWKTNNPMNDPEKRKLVGASKVGKRIFVRPDGTRYYAFPEKQS